MNRIRATGLESVTPHRVREAVKLLADRRTPEGFELVMLMHYERSRESWAACKKAGEHPPWEDYARAYIAGDIARGGILATIAAESGWCRLMTRYPPKPSALLPSGASHWGKAETQPWDEASLAAVSAATASITTG